MKCGKAIKTVCVILSCAVFFGVGFCAFAWLASLIESDDFGITAGNLEDNSLQIAKIVHTDGNAETTEDMRSYYDCADYGIEKNSEPTASGDNYLITIEKLSFGLIDNVASHRPDNIVYFKFTIPKTNGENVKIKFFYNTDADGYFVDMYTGNSVTDGGEDLRRKITPEELAPNSSEPLLDRFQDVEAQQNDSYLNFALLVSSEDYSASELYELEYYGMEGEIASDAKNNLYKFKDFDSSSDCVELSASGIGGDGDSYFVYVKVEPDLSVFGASIEYISNVMPCEVYFKIKAFIEIY